MGYEPYRIDLLVDVEGLDFETCYAQRTEAELNGLSLHFLSIEDLITAKKTAARLQDLADAEQLIKIAHKRFKS